MIQGFLGGLKFLITGFFGLENLVSMFLGGLIYVGFFFLRIQNNQKLQSFCVMLLMKQNMFMSVSSVVRIQRARKFGMRFFLWG